MRAPLRLLVPLDRLDGRRHTFGTYLTGLLGAMAPSLDALVVTRKRERSYPELDGLPQETIPRALEGDPLYKAAFPLWARRFRATVVHYPYRFAPYLWWGLPARKVVTVHDTALLTLPGELVSRMAARAVWRYRRSLRRFDAVVTVSHASKGELLSHFDLPGELVHVVHHGVDGRFRRGAAERDLRGRYGVEPPYILNVSSLKRKKNIVGLVRAFALLHREGYPHRLVLVGKPDEAADEVRRTVADEGLSGRVVMTGFVDQADHPEFYRQASLLVYPSFYEGFGIPVLEAMASGCPVVTSGVSSLPEVAGDAALLVNPSSVHEIHQAMKSVLDDGVLRATLVEKGLRRAKLFTWERAAAAHLELYRDLLDRPAARRQAA